MRMTAETIPMPLAAPVSTPPLFEGDCLSSDEFLRRWDEMPDLRHAELIEGIVYMSSPVSRPHGRCHIVLATWLGNYAAATPGCFPGLEGTWRMGPSNVPQPDLMLHILPEHGGQSTVEGPYYAGAPELIVEVAVSSYSRDFGVKKRLYERMGVREYLIALPRQKKLVCHRLTPAGFQIFEPIVDGIFRSGMFPGLWLDMDALWKLDLARMNTVLQQGLATPEHAAFAAQVASGKR
jgi:Uma2 family endonuclease